MNEATCHQLIVVLGMHRSGTSAITKSLESLGVGLGTNMHPAGFDNPTGFWEDSECLAINDALLAHLDSAYDRLCLAWTQIPVDATTSALKMQAARLLERKLHEHGGRWGFKDPRTCRLLAFWMEVFGTLTCQVHFLIAVRHPASVAMSMAERNDIPFEKAYWLWLQHVVPTIVATRGFSRVVVDYDQFLAQPLHHLRRVADRFGLQLQTTQAADFQQNFLEGALRHSVHTLPMLRLDRRASPTVVDAYALLSGLAVDALSLDDEQVHRQFEGFGHQLQLAEPSFAYANHLEDARVELWHAVADRERRLQDAAAQLSGAQEREQSVQAQIEHLVHSHAEVIAQLNADAVERDDRIQEYLESLSQLEGQINQARTEAVDRSAQLSQLEAEVAEKDRHLESLAQKVQRLQEQADRVAPLEAEVASRTSQLQERDAQAALLEASLASNEGQLKALEQRAQGLQIQMADSVSARAADGQVAAQRVRELEDQVFWLTRGGDDVRRELAQVLASKSWQLTRGLRWLRREGVSKPTAQAKSRLAVLAQASWHRLPLAASRKRALKDYVFGRFPKLLGDTQAHRAWVTFNSPIDVEPVTSLVLAPPPACCGTQDYVPLLQAPALGAKPARVLCFYLPQFHPIPENNAWWGDGFTEWTNVRPAQPQFEGHYQPHVPDELGYYDLVKDPVAKRQVELAKLYGIEGFCFYFYWFGGKRLLEQPIRNYLDDASLDLPFCLCWANENWSRRWDGLDSDVLIAQNHSEEDDLAFIAHVAEYMRDARYIRMDGKPLLLIYRPSLLPNARQTVGRWRDWCRANGIGEIYLAYTQSFETVDPQQYGFDAAIEFPPNNSAPPNVTDRVVPTVEQFGTTVYDWNVFLERSKNYKRPGYKLFRSVCPSWDNTARKKNRGTVFLGSTPAKYQQWLVNAIKDVRATAGSPDESLVFVNAWNEWAEGAHLEPDARYGYAWLQATRDALVACGAKPRSARRIILVSHDAHPHGAQYLALNLARTLAGDLGFDIDLVLLGEGVLRSEYAKWARVHDLAGVDPLGPQARRLAALLVAQGHASAIVNTTVSGLFLQTLKAEGIRCVALIHELPGIIKSHRLESHVRSVIQHADVMVFPADAVADAFCALEDATALAQVVRPQGLYKKNRYKGQAQEARRAVRAQLGIPQDSEIVLNVGYADHRKGIDRFVRIGLSVLASRPRAHFVWVGHWDAVQRGEIDALLVSNPLRDRFLFVGRQSDTDAYYAGADLFALTSREDPFPSVVLESLEVAVPVVGFAGAGGFTTFLAEAGGVLAAADDEADFARVLVALLDEPARAHALGLAGAEAVVQRFSFRHYVYDLLDLAGQPLKRVSAVVPNFNYARYLDQRLASIFAQTYPIYEILVLDDASTDDSVEVARRILERQHIDFRLILNAQNSGSVFKQWEKGCKEARGDYLWICEADDDASPALVESLVGLMSDGDVVLAYAQSRQIDESGATIDHNYLRYTDEVSPAKWRVDYVEDGSRELTTVLRIKNTIPNVSAVLFSRKQFEQSMALSRATVQRMKVAGDWLIYANILRFGKIGFVAKALNAHRRHQGSVTASPASRARHLAEIIFMQNYVGTISPAVDASLVHAQDYVRRIYAQFSLDPCHAREPERNEQVAQALRWLEADG